MALKPENALHAAQILAGTTGRKRGHSFEALVADTLNSIPMPFSRHPMPAGCLFKGTHPGRALLNLVLNELKIPIVESVNAFSAGALATAEEGVKQLLVNNVVVKRCKSDVILTLKVGKRIITKGISIKQCSNKNPTNAQLYFSTATAFCQLLKRNKIKVSDSAIDAMRMFCGDTNYRPKDKPTALSKRKTDPNRWFWEELPTAARKELEGIFTKQQDAITRLLLQKAYLDDPFPPEFLVHQTRLARIFHQARRFGCVPRKLGYELIFEVRNGVFAARGHTPPYPHYLSTCRGSTPAAQPECSTLVAWLNRDW